MLRSTTTRHLTFAAIGLALLLLGCGAESGADGGTGGGVDWTSAGSGGEGGTTAGTGGAGGSPTSSSSAGGGSGQLDVLLAALAADTAGALLEQSRGAGWPAPVEEGYLLVSTELDHAAGDHEGWVGAAMNDGGGFHWLVVALDPGGRYKFTDGGSNWQADPWSRAYGWDDNGQMSMRAPDSAHLERHFQVGDGVMAPRTVRVWVPADPVTHLLYAHDGQNLFNPSAIWGGWKLDESAPDGMMLVGIDNTSARMDEYTHVTDKLSGQTVGGAGDAYGTYVTTTVRPLVARHYGEPAKLGVMGSSLGGLISFHIADQNPGMFTFAASLSGTMGWGSIGTGVTNPTMMQRYAEHGHQDTALYVDSGGSGPCSDTDEDGTDDDGDGSDNYCENKQLESVLEDAGYFPDVDLWHWHEPGAEHNEQAWAARVWRPLDLFAAL